MVVLERLVDVALSLVEEVAVSDVELRLSLVLLVNDSVDEVSVKLVDVSLTLVDVRLSLVVLVCDSDDDVALSLVELVNDSLLVVSVSVVLLVRLSEVEVADSVVCRGQRTTPMSAPDSIVSSLSYAPMSNWPTCWFQTPMLSWSDFPISSSPIQKTGKGRKPVSIASLEPLPSLGVGHGP